MVIAAISADCNAQNLFGFNGYHSLNSISCDSLGMKRKIFAVPGFGGGVVYKHMELRNMIGFQAEMNFDYSGFKIKPDEYTYYSQRLKYVTIPLMMHVDFGKYAVKALFAIGTYGSFLIDRAAPKTNIEDIESSMVARIDVGTYNVFTYGLCGQAGIAFCTKYGVFEILGRGSVGMSKMKDLGPLALMNYMTSRQVSLGVSYLVPFGKGEKYFTHKEKPEKPEKERRRKKDDSISADSIDVNNTEESNLDNLDDFFNNNTDNM